jgi:hypothetical protein
MPEYKVCKEKNITFIVTSARDLTDSEIDSCIAAHIKDKGQPKNGSTNLVNLWTPKSRMQNE